jgi:hypothetical protein
MSNDDNEYILALSKRAKEILQMDEPKKESKEKKETKAKNKKDVSEEQRQMVLERLVKARAKANEVRIQKKEIKEAQLKEKHEEFESLKKKYLKPKEEKEEEKTKLTPKRERANITPYQEENIKETDNVSLVEKSKPVDIPKPEIKEEKKEIIINSPPPPPPQPEKAFYVPRMKYIKKHNLFF